MTTTRIHAGDRARRRRLEQASSCASFSLWTFAVVLLTLAAAAHRRSGVGGEGSSFAGAVAVTATALVAAALVRLPVERRTRTRSSTGRRSLKPLWERRPVAFYVDPGLPELDHAAVPAVVSEPVLADDLRREAGATTSACSPGGPGRRSGPGCAPGADRRRASPALSPPPWALFGWLAARRSARRLRASPALLLVALLPLAGIAGMLYFTVSYPTPDGDVIKATYMLTTLPPGRSPSVSRPSTSPAPAGIVSR